MKAVVAPLLLALGALSLGGAILHAARHPGAGNFHRMATTEVEPGAFPKLLRNGARRELIPAPPVRIASLTVASDEILTVLVAPRRLAAVSRFARDPAISTCTDRVPEGTPSIRGVDPERIIAMEPDLVFTAHYTQESALRILGSATIPVVRLQDVHAFDDVIANVRLVAAAVGEDALGEALLADMRERLRVVEAQIRGRPRPRVLYLSAGGYTTGARTLLDEKIRKAGGRNVAAAASLVGDVSVSLDLLVALDPDIIIVPRWSEDTAEPIREITNSPAWRDSRVVREGRVRALAAGVLTSESQDAALGVERLARVLHPEAFSS